jgi:hypothetical protein
MFEIKIVKDINLEDWNELLSHSEEATIFHTKEWIEVLVKTYSNYKPLYIIAIKNNKIIGGMPVINDKRFGVNNFISMPLSTYGGPVVLDSDISTINGILREFSKLNKSLNVGLLRIIDFSKKCDFLKYFGFYEKKLFTHILNLNFPWDYILANKINKKTRNVRQSQKRGVTVESVKNKVDVHLCYEMITNLAKRHNTTPLPFELYDNFFKIMTKSGLVKWEVAKYKNIPIATCIYFTYKDKIFYWINASYKEYQILRPNDLLVYSMIKWGVENGYKYCNFGASPPEAKGLIQFKENWGAEKVEYSMYEKKSKLFKVVKFFKNKLKK